MKEYIKIPAIKPGIICKPYPSPTIAQLNISDNDPIQDVKMETYPESDEKYIKEAIEKKLRQEQESKEYEFRIEKESKEGKAWRKKTRRNIFLNAEGDPACNYKEASPTNECGYVEALCPAEINPVNWLIHKLGRRSSKGFKKDIRDEFIKKQGVGSFQKRKMTLVLTFKKPQSN